MLLDELTPAEQEAWEELRAAERAAELARLRWWAVSEAPRRKTRLRLVESVGETRDARDARSFPWS
jgi:hypothetical protein